MVIDIIALAVSLLMTGSYLYEDDHAWIGWALSALWILSSFVTDYKGNIIWV